MSLGSHDFKLSRASGSKQKEQCVQSCEKCWWPGRGGWSRALRPRSRVQGAGVQCEAEPASRLREATGAGHQAEEGSCGKGEGRGWVQDSVSDWGGWRPGALQGRGAGGAVCQASRRGRGRTTRPRMDTAGHGGRQPSSPSGQPAKQGRPEHPLCTGHQEGLSSRRCRRYGGELGGHQDLDSRGSVTCR